MHDFLDSIASPRNNLNQSRPTLKLLKLSAIDHRESLHLFRGATIRVIATELKISSRFLHAAKQIRFTFLATTDIRSVSDKRRNSNRSRYTLANKSISLFTTDFQSVFHKTSKNFIDAVTSFDCRDVITLEEFERNLRIYMKIIIV